MESFLSVSGTIITIAGAFFAGWFVATDKNRSELFNQRLASYKQLSAQISKVYTLGVALNNFEIEDPDDTYKKEASALLHLLTTEALFLEENSLKQVFDFLKMKPSEYSDNKKAINDIVCSFRKDLSLKNLDIINQLSALRVDTKKWLRK